jgi:extradiol dioxygenase
LEFLSLAYAGVSSPAAREWPRFASDVLAMMVWEGADGTQYLKMDERKYRIAIHPGEKDRLLYFGWDVLDDEALAEGVRRAQAAGLEAGWASDRECEVRMVNRMSWFVDRNGIRHEFCFGQLREHPRSFIPPRAHAGFVTGQQGFGHAVLFVPDLEKTLDLFVRMMGMRISDETDLGPYGRAVFLLCNARWHTLGVLGRPGHRGLHHFAVQTRELEDVGVAYDACQSAGIPITMTLGQHDNDRSLSFYCRTPSGFDFEYSWGAVEVVDGPWIPTLLRKEKVSDGQLWGHQIIDAGPQSSIEIFDQE